MEYEIQCKEGVKGYRLGQTKTWMGPELFFSRTVCIVIKKLTSHLGLRDSH